MFEISGLPREGKEPTLEMERNVGAQYSDHQRRHNLILVPNRNPSKLTRT